MSDERELIDDEGPERVDGDTDDFEAHQLDLGRVDEGDGNIDVGLLDDESVDVGKLDEG